MTGSSTTTTVTPPVDPSLRLVTLGRAALLGTDNIVAVGPGKALALLTYLRSSPGQLATRDQLVDLLWADTDPTLGRQALRQTLFRLRLSLGAEAFSRDREEVVLAAELPHDRQTFLDAIGANDLPAALASYSGAFFPEFGASGSSRFEHWADGERHHLRGLFLRAGETACRRALDQSPRDALALARRLRNEEPESEALQRLFLQSALAAREMLLAATEADALENALREAGRSPEPATAALIRLVRQEGVEYAGPPTRRSAMAELVGREREYSTLLAAWDEAVQSRPRVVHLEGGAGLGKSRLLHDFGVRLRAGGVPVVHVGAHQGEQELGGSLAADLVRALFDLPGASGIGPEFVPALIGLHPPLAARFPHAGAVTPEVDLLRQRGVAVAELLTAIAEERPIALLVDDLHWLDLQSRQILVGAANRLGTARILLVTAARPGERGGALVPAASVCRLQPLSVADCEAFVASAAGTTDPNWVAQIAVALWRTSRGSPLLATETLQLALERGDLVVRDGTWQTTDVATAVERVGSYDPLHDRVRSLADDERHLLLTLAAAGSPLPEAIIGAGPRATSQLMGLEARGYAARSGPGWTIGHDEIGAAVLDQAPPDEIVGCHRQLGRQLAIDPAPLPQLHRAARHLILGAAEGDLATVVHRWCTAHRRQGDTRSAAALIAELLGAEFGTADRAARLRAGLPFGLRFGLTGRGLIGAGLVLVAAVFVVAALRRPKPAPPSPEASLLFTVPEAGGEYQALVQVGVREDRWRPGDSLDVTEGVRVGRWHESSAPTPTPAVRPGGGALIAPRIVEDSGQVDLFLSTFDGQTTRVTSTPGDDIDPAWSPDGRQVVFATARWTPRGDDDLDLAVLELATGAVRQLTNGIDYDHAPVWSPDGTRIAFVRRPAIGPSQLCWTTLEGLLRCPLVADWPQLVGWRDGGSVIVVDGAGHWLALSVDSGTTARLFDEASPGVAKLSPDGKWVAADIFMTPNAAPRTVAFPLARPDHRIALGPSGGLIMSRVAWIPQLSHRAVEQLALAPTTSARLGVAHRLRLDATDSIGRPVAVAPEVVRWWVEDSSIATINPSTGELIPLGLGRVVVHASADGWRTTSQPVTIEANIVTAMPSEYWADSTLAGWRRLGNPVPSVFYLADGARALAINGDGSFDSGLLGLVAIGTSRGMGADFLVSTPIDRTKWQSLRLHLISHPTVGANGMATGQLSCGFTIPTGEGDSNKNRIGFTGGGLRPAPAELVSGRWYRLRLQVFPDGTCGVALNGRALWREDRGANHDSVQVLAHGQSVGTRVAIRSIETWQGVKPDVDWGRLEVPRTPVRIP